MVSAIGSGILLYQNDTDDETPKAVARLDVGYYMNNPRMTGTGPDGKVLYRISADTAKQSLQQGGITMEAIKMAYAPETAIPWLLVADTGNIPPDGNIIYLDGNVIATSEQEGQLPTLFLTEHLEVDPDQFVANTDRKVTIVNAGNRIYATGMRAWLREDRLQLTSNVNGKYFT